LAEARTVPVSEQAGAPKGGPLASLGKPRRESRPLAKTTWRILAVAALTPGCAPALPASAASSVLNQTVSFALPSDGGLLVSVPLSSPRTTVVDVWAPSCVPCRRSLPAIVKRQAELEAHGAKLVLVAVLSDAETTEGARATLVSWGANSPFLIDRGDTLRTQAGVDALPATLVIDRAGVVRWVAPPSASVDDIVRAARLAP
jgi:thiol-disulfide isomerase/thioredoxin